jgi:2-polyprenyl-3-methyl-5-hydroxy-6-metoxy-1,4-benzoquinol methylase
MEKKLYDLHQNQIDDPGYLRFLSRLATPLLDTLPSARRILDYGCGPTPALASLLTQAGHHVTVYDPFYFPSTRPLQARYQAITCSEVAEHFHHPFDEFAFLDTLLEEGGWLGVMTCFQTEDQRFGQWHYRRDPTHVCFYRRETFEVIAFQRDWQCHFPAKNIALMFKPYS